MDKAQLLPCPFCGGHGVLRSAGEAHEVSCMSASCRAYLPMIAFESGAFGSSRGTAVDAWNRRPTQPPSASGERILFPAHLRKMWSGTEVQAWLDDMTGAVTVRPTAKGSLERYRQWQAEQVAPSPGIDAAEQTPVGYASDDGMESLRKFGQCSIVAGPARTAMTDYVHPLYAAPPAAQPSAEWLAEAERLAKDLRNKAMAAGWGKTNDEPADDAYAALLAHLRTKP